MAIAGFRANVKVAGSPVAFTNESTSTEDNLVFQVVDGMKRVFDPYGEIVVEVDVDGDGTTSTPVVADPSSYEVNRLRGEIIFQAEQPVGAIVTVSGDYLPMSNVADAYEYSYSLEGNNETSQIFTKEWMIRKQTQKDCTGSLSRWENMDNLFFNAIDNDQDVLLEFYSDVSMGYDLRCWAKFSANEKSSSVAGLIEESLEFEATEDIDRRVVDLG